MENVLKEFGLTDNEIKIYVLLLKLGASTPAIIAEKTGFSRPYVYDAVERLLEKHVVSSVFKNGKKNYLATEPKYLVEIETQRLERIKSIVPSLDKLKYASSEDIKVEHHTGKYIYKVMLNSVITALPNGGEILLFGLMDEYLIKNDKHYLTHLQQYYLRAKELGIKEKIIVKKNDANYTFPMELSEFRFLKDEVIGNTSFQVYGKFVAIFLWGNQNHLILIENKDVADSYRKQFNLLWNIAKIKK